jgi:hypothetical protein
MWNRYARDVCDSIKMFDSTIAKIAACMVWGSGDKPLSAIHKSQITVTTITTLKGMLSASYTRGLTCALSDQGDMSADILQLSQEALTLCGLSSGSFGWSRRLWPLLLKTTLHVQGCIVSRCIRAVGLI